MSRTLNRGMQFLICALLALSAAALASQPIYHAASRLAQLTAPVAGNSSATNDLRNG